MNLRLIKCFSLLLPLLVVLGGCASKSPVSPSVSTANRMFGGTAPVAAIDRAGQREFEKAVKIMKSGQLLEAEQLFAQLAKRYPNLASVHANMSVIYFNEGRFSDAENAIEQAIKMNRRRAELHNFRGVILREQGRFQDAALAYLAAIDINRKYADAFLNLGVLYDLYLFDAEKAKRYYRAYLALRPGQADQVNAWLVDMQQRAQVSN